MKGPKRDVTWLCATKAKPQINEVKSSKNEETEDFMEWSLYIL